MWNCGALCGLPTVGSIHLWALLITSNMWDLCGWVDNIQLLWSSPLVVSSPRLLLSTEMLAAQVTLCVAMIVDWCHLKYVGGWMGWLHNLQNLISFCDPTLRVASITCQHADSQHHPTLSPMSIVWWTMFTASASRRVALKADLLKHDGVAFWLVWQAWQKWQALTTMWQYMEFVSKRLM